MIKETFLHFIWKLQYFQKEKLVTTQGEEIQILYQGLLNSDSGPDFSNARVKIGKLEWIGNVEVHINSSDWKLHNHQHDEAYNNVILHVVWVDDEPVRRDNDSLIPTIEIKGRVSEKMILKYSALINAKESIPCTNHKNSVPDLVKISMIDKTVEERLNGKSQFVKELVQRNKGDWQESLYQLVAKNFGFKLNADPLLRLAYSIPLKSLLWHRESLFQMEALLFGQSGLLQQNYKDEYPNNLKKEYEFLSKKFRLDQQSINQHEWKFLRIRPANFPTIRLAEFASFIYSNNQFFNSIADFNSVKEVIKLFKNTNVSDYWNDHYLFDRKVKRKAQIGIGDSSIESIIINTIVPFLYCLGKEKDNDRYVELALKFLEETNAESNKIVKGMYESGFVAKSAYESQGCLELFNSYCSKKRCLDCKVGWDILKENKALMSI
jgi:hypothetical protein